MLHVSNISKSYGVDTVLAGISFVANAGERIGLVGPNGCGKTTLLRIIAGAEAADKGRVRFDPPDLSVGYLAQALEFAPDEIMDQALKRATAGHHRAWSEMQRLARQMSQENADLSTLNRTYAQAEARFETAGGYALEARLEMVLDGLDLADVPRDLPVERLSGGQKTRLGLAGLLTRQPQLLLLDEPTNHLDLDALDWLEKWLRDYEGAVLIVSHDRTFLDATITRTLVIDPDSHTLRDFAGNYMAYTEARAREIDQQWQTYQDQQEEILRLHNAARRLRGQAVMKRGGKADSGDKFAKGFYSDQSARSVGRAKQIERRLERLQNEVRVDKPSRHWKLKVDFADDTGGAREVLRLQDVAMGFGGRTLFKNVNLTLTHGQCIVFIGPNGMGKTTLLRLIMGELSPTAGEIFIGSGVKVGYGAQEQEVLDLRLTPYDTLRAEAEDMDQTDIRRFLHQFLFTGDDVFVPVEHLSFGERARLSLALLVARGCNFLLLDEPINHLDIPGREQFEDALLQFPGTTLAVAHDRRFIERVATGIWELKDQQIYAAV